MLYKTVGFIFITLGLVLSAAAQTEVTAIRAGKIIDPESGTVRTNQIILVTDGLITDIGPNLKPPANAKVIDLSHETVLPGLMDAHTHLCAAIDPKWDLGDFWIYALQHRAGFRAILGVKHTKEMLEAGFTTVRDLGNAGDYLNLDLEKAIRFGLVPGPTIIWAGRIIAPFGGQFWDTPADPNHLDNPEYYFADSHDELRKAIRENIYWNAKVIKIVIDSQKYIYSTDDIRFIVKEAAAAGVKVAAHAQTERGAHNAIEAGVASLEHGWRLTDDDMALAVRNNVVLVSTDFPEEHLLGLGWEPPDAKRIHTARIERLRRAYRAGLLIVFGTDVMHDEEDRTRGMLSLDYIDSFVEAGIPAKYILQSMTTQAARLLGVEKERGKAPARSGCRYNRCPGKSPRKYSNPQEC